MKKNDFFKENMFIVFVAASLALLVLVVILARSISGVRRQTKELQEQISHVANVKTKVDDFYRKKPYVEEEIFRKQIPVGVMTPLQAIRNTNLILREAGVAIESPVEVVVDDEEEKSSIGERTQDTPTTDKGEYQIGSKTVKALGFKVTCVTTYPSLMAALDKLSSTIPVVIINKFEIKGTNVPHLLRVSLELTALTEKPALQSQ